MRKMSDVLPGFMFTVVQGNVFHSERQFLMLAFHSSFTVTPEGNGPEDEELDTTVRWIYYTDGHTIFGMPITQASKIEVKDVRRFSGNFGQVDWYV